MGSPDLDSLAPVDLATLAAKTVVLVAADDLLAHLGLEPEGPSSHLASTSPSPFVARSTCLAGASSSAGLAQCDLGLRLRQPPPDHQPCGFADRGHADTYTLSSGHPGDRTEGKV